MSVQNLVTLAAIQGNNNSSLQVPQSGMHFIFEDSLQRRFVCYFCFTALTNLTGSSNNVGTCKSAISVYLACCNSLHTCLLFHAHLIPTIFFLSSSHVCLNYLSRWGYIFLNWFHCICAALLGKSHSKTGIFFPFI